MTKTVILPSYPITLKKNHTPLENWTKGYFLENNRGVFLETIIGLSIPICFWGLVGNSILFWLLCNKVKKTSFTVYAFNLAIADFIVCIYFIIVFSLSLTAFYISLDFSLAMESIFSFVYSASIYFLTALSSERYFMVFFPVYYEHHHPRNFSKIMCSVFWLWCCLISLIIYVTCYPRFLSSHFLLNSNCKAVVIFEITIHLVLLFPIMSFSALSLFIRMHRKAKPSPQVRLDITIIIMVAISLIFVFTFRMVHFLAYWNQTLGGPIPFHLSLLFDSIKSCITPFVYLVAGNWKRELTLEPIYVILERALKGEKSMDTMHTSNHKLVSKELRHQKRKKIKK